MNSICLSFGYMELVHLLDIVPYLILIF